MNEEGRGLRLSVQEALAAIWIALGAIVVAATSRQWSFRPLTQAEFLLRFIGLLGAMAFTSLLYTAWKSKVEALLSGHWRGVLAGLSVMVMFGWLDVIETVFEVPPILHFYKLGCTVLATFVAGWSLTSYLTDLTSGLTAKRAIPRVDPLLVLVGWLALLTAVVIAQRPWEWPTMPEPKLGEVPFDIINLAFDAVLGTRLLLESRRSGYPARWLLRCGSAALYLGAAASVFTTLDDTLIIPRIVRIVGVSGSAAVALGFALALVAYYLYGTTALRPTLPGVAGHLGLPEVGPIRSRRPDEWSRLGTFSGRVILFEVSTMRGYADALEDLASHLKSKGYRIVLIGRRSSPAAPKIAKHASLTLYVSAGRMGPPKQVGVGEFEIGADPAVILGMISRAREEGDRLAAIVEDTTGLLVLLGGESTYRLLRAMIDQLAAHDSVVVMVLPPEAHDPKLVNLLRSLATNIIDLTEGVEA